MRYLADKIVGMETNCGLQGHPSLPHVHYVHRRYLAWVDQLIWRYKQYRLKRLLKKYHSSIYVADWSYKK